MKVFHKDPNDKLDYMMDWTNEMTLLVDTINASQWAISPSGALAVDSDANDDNTATVWLTDGNAAATYIVSNQITTAGGRIIERSFKVHVLEL